TVNSANLGFTAQVALPLDTNTIMVTSELDGRQTEPSPVVTVIKDKVAPVLLVEKPLDNAKVNVEVVHVIGNVVDNIELAKLEINDKAVVLDAEGNFHERLMLNPGANTITVKATDGAGNVTTVVRTVLVELEAPDITNIEPSGNVELRAGDILTVSFNAPTGGNGYFRLLMPFGLQSNDLGIPMTEVDGLYTGTWTVPANLVATGLKVQVVYVNEYGFKITKMAAGSVTVIGNMADLVNNTMVIGNEAFDMDYVNTNAYAQSRLIEAYNAGEEVYIKLNENTIVNGEGQMRSIVELPDEVTYFDINGEVLYYAK
ncbi:MAG: hypothetical protein RIN63_15215, partial [Tissierella sp.]|nr:hypothetical protein [Tissierella sp.]